MTVVALALTAALLHAAWNAMIKGGGDRVVLLAAITVLCQAGGGIAAFFVTPPAPASWPFIALSLLLHGGYYAFLLQAYRVGDLSQIYPLSRGTAPLLVAVGSWAVAGEVLSARTWIGIGIASLGICSLAFQKGLPWRGDWRPLAFALGTSLFIAAYTVSDGMGVRASGAPLGYVAWLFLLDGFGIGLYALWRRGPALAGFLAERWLSCLLGGLAAGLAYGLVIVAMSFGAMALVSALRETSVVFATLLGIVVLKERLSLLRIVAAILIAAGLAIATA